MPLPPIGAMKPLMVSTTPPLERFMRAIKKLPNGCWEWSLSRNIKSGYGQFSTSRTGTAIAHVWAYKNLKAEIPQGMTVEHTCHTLDLSCQGGISCPHRICVNPDHLELLSREENVRRGRKIQAQLAKTHCPQDHEYTPENTMTYNGMRSCRMCNRERKRK